MKFSKFSELVARIWSNPHTQRRNPEIKIIIHSPGSIGATPSVEVEAIYPGFDWDAGQVMIYPAQPLTILTPEQVNDITESVRKGQSWHAYEAYKKHKTQLENAALEHVKVAGQRDALLAALEDTIAMARSLSDVQNAYIEETVDEFIAGDIADLIARVKGGAA